MGRSGPSASQAREVSTAGRRIGTRLSSTRDSPQKGPLNETDWSEFFRFQEGNGSRSLLVLKCFTAASMLLWLTDTQCLRQLGCDADEGLTAFSPF